MISLGTLHIFSWIGERSSIGQHRIGGSVTFYFNNNLFFNQSWVVLIQRKNWTKSMNALEEIGTTWMDGGRQLEWVILLLLFVLGI